MRFTIGGMSTNARVKLLPDGPFIEIDGDALYLGRDCHLAAAIPALKHKVLSNRHCCIKRQPDGRWTLEDLNSTNGTWLRNDRLTHKAVVISGDVFSLGRFGPKVQCEIPAPPDPNAPLREDEFAAAATRRSPMFRARWSYGPTGPSLDGDKDEPHCRKSDSVEGRRVCQSVSVV